jgi:hypothetical protein
MRAQIALILAASILCGCVASNAVVRSQTMSFDDIIEDTTDKLLVLNILRAKDKAPLHFDEMPSIHESVTGTASAQGVWPFGPSNKGTVRNTLTAGAGIQVAPSFELDNLATKDFITGMATPIDPKFVKYWLDRGLDRRVVLLLFFSAIDVTVAGPNGAPAQRLRIRNAPRDAIDALYSRPPSPGVPSGPTFAAAEANTCVNQTDFQHYLKLINNLTTFTAQSSPQKKIILDSVPVGDADLGRVLAALTTLDATKTSVKYDKDHHTLSLYGLSAPTTELCLSTSQVALAGTPPAQNTCSGTGVAVSAKSVDAGEAETLTPQDFAAFPPFAGREDPRVGGYCDGFGRLIEQLHPREAGDLEDGKPTLTASDAPKPVIRMEIRSVGEIIQFLGDLLAYQEAIGAYLRAPPGPNLPRMDTSKLHPIVTFGFCGYTPTPEPHCGDYFFNVHEGDESEDSRFAVHYRRHTYHVPQFSRPDQWQARGLAPCSKPGSQPGSDPGSDPSCLDHTLEVLAVVNQLIDLQRSAQDVQQTPYVSVLP